MKILVVSDGRRGIENQALGLAEAVSRLGQTDSEIERHVIAHRPSFAALPPSLQMSMRRDFGLPDADLVIGCGRQAIAPLMSLRRSGHAAFTVFVQDPRTEPSRFDLVVAPEHDGLSGPFVENMIGAPNRVTRDAIISDTLSFAARLAALPMPRALIAIGGPSKTHSLNDAMVQSHLDAATTLIQKNYSLLITTSRRTPDTVRAAWTDLAERSNNVWLHTPDDVQDNPYFAFLGGADIILVTEDSTNMLTESCSTGKPVYRLPMAGKPGKFETLYDTLSARCHVRAWDGTITQRPYPALAETERVAKRILDRLALA